MIKTKQFDDYSSIPPMPIDEQINKWIAKHPDNIIVDVKLQSNVINDIDSYCVVRDELIIYREYENV